ncbi:uncharacterized protein An05g01300 [Aspergillus niger]|uniref:Contig An05c0050, genomic contig n=2 Tax=Aspergillus niger TaxID=5061 RepID=A2QKT2_ASPNC|nr:uncharacterized protein An05g01300 [Aspergillus niger]CAK96469.1 unnamed protein product [Aspergillus niger]
MDGRPKPIDQSEPPKCWGRAGDTRGSRHNFGFHGPFGARREAHVREQPWIGGGRWQNDMASFRSLEAEGGQDQVKEEGEASNTTTHYRKGFLPNVEKPLFFLQQIAARGSEADGLEWTGVWESPTQGFPGGAGDANLEKLIEGSCAFPYSLTGEPTSRISQSLQRGGKEGKMRRWPLQSQTILYRFKLLSDPDSCRSPARKFAALTRKIQPSTSGTDHGRPRESGPIHGMTRASASNENLQRSATTNPDRADRTHTRQCAVALGDTTGWLWNHPLVPTKLCGCLGCNIIVSGLHIAPWHDDAG